MKVFGNMVYILSGGIPKTLIDTYGLSEDQVSVVESFIKEQEELGCGLLIGEVRDDGVFEVHVFKTVK